MIVNLMKNDIIIFLKGIEYSGFFKGDQYSFPLDNDLTISNREGDQFFNKLLESEEKINLFIISENVQKSTIDYIKEKCNGLFCNYKINVFEYGDILLGNIELDIENIIIKDNHGLQFYFLNDNWIEKSI